MVGGIAINKMTAIGSGNVEAEAVEAEAEKVEAVEAEAVEVA